MDFHKENLDLILVPCGLLILFSYHIFLLYKHLDDSNSTVIGLENKDKKEWVQRVVQGNSSDYDRAVSVISSNTTAAAYLATISLTLCSLIGTFLGKSSSTDNMFQSKRIYGDTRPFTIFLKDISLLACLLVAFSGFIQAARHLVHASYLMSSPDNKNHVKKLEFAIIKGGDFWLFGLRALYFALIMVLWFFGPVPMFVSSILMVIILYYHDICTVTLHNVYCQQDNQKGNKAASVRGRFSY
ncbi:uncharacterized protein LOC8281870 [Ricinus communis]|uniref:Uncharacterized protein n=1 Tax=Ricinus communis TaxID=3988 RepID=B9S930_RICCO|nr:uncharacterized protein LOC8281870 [Ricinus communis]EEF39799.1 conserved hypothetical protein [Ricinus communis]|eukprot:XP_002522499.1 uncharacterized protein LOC8281870 [Ricinus communis]